MTYSGSAYSEAPYSGDASPDTVQVDVDPLDLILGIHAVSAGAATLPETPEDPASVREWTLQAVTRDGELIAELPNANAKTWVRTLNEPDEITFESPKYDPATLNLAPLVEVQLYRYAHLRAWGPVLGDGTDSTTGAVSFTGRGPWFYFRRRFFGTAERTSLLANGDFELGAATGALNAYVPGWTRAGDVQLRHWTAATKPGGHGLPAPLRGEKAISLASDQAGANTYVRTRFEYRTDFPPGQRLTFAAWVYIADGWIGPAAYQLGLYAERVVGGVVETRCYAEIDEDTDRGEWVRLECSMIVRPRRDGYVEVRLYSPAGWVAWDESLSVLMESTGAGFTPTDQVNLAATIVQYGQTGRGKSDLNIGTSCPETGVLRKRAWQHADHAWLADAVDELAGFTDGFDHAITLTPTTRTFRTYFPRKGTDRTGYLTLKLGAPADGGNLASYRVTHDGANVATALVARGAGDGPDREEGLAIDTSEVDGLILDDYLDAPSDLPIGELDDYAENELGARKRPVEVLEVTVRPGATVTIDEEEVELLDVLDTGDLAGVLIDDGYVQVDDDYRMVRISVDCLTDAITLTLNRWVP